LDTGIAFPRGLWPKVKARVDDERLGALVGQLARRIELPDALD
jgi:hypothetical protein